MPPTPALPSAAIETVEAHYDRCVDLATADPARGVIEATAWHSNGGGFISRQCLGIAHANQQDWSAAAQQFTMAAQEAEVAHDARAAHYWAQAGNAWIAAGEPAKARAALDAALAAGTLEGLQRGEAQFDRGRALVATGDLESARADVDRALELAGGDPLIWLASAALARRMDDLPRARKDIAQAFRLSSDDPSVYLEIGNIAAFGGDEAGAKSAWSDAIRVAPSSPAAASARKALQQFETDPPKP
ncbi:MAG: hypothetical protein B7Y47_14000 [Sphingomonas sp. 28-63-12]|nr:MAG: hypothetical protein B7Y47_14000 [Sphingomonas sp. 28-63-12]